MKFVSILVLSLALTGCASFRSASTQTATIRAGAAVATTLVLDAAVSPGDLASKKAIVKDVAVVIQQLASGNTPTPAELNAVLDRYIQGSSKYTKFSTALKGLYAEQYAKVGGDGRAVVNILNAIAQGVIDATAE